MKGGRSVKSEEGKRVTREEYFARYYEDELFKYEYCNGVLEKAGMPTKNDLLLIKFIIFLLDEFFKVNPIGDFFQDHISFSVNFPGKEAERIPDITVILYDNPERLDGEESRFKGVFDLCIEVVSNSNKRQIIRDVVDKKQEYETMKVKEYYILDSKKAETRFYRLDEQSGKYEEIKAKEDGVIESEILKGFKFRERDLYERPGEEDLMSDPVYMDYVRVDLREERRLKERAEIKAKEERKQRTEAEEELKKLRYEIEMLRSRDK